MICYLLQVDVEAGEIFWRPRPRVLFKNERSFKAWNKRFAGSEAFLSTDKDGYRVARIFGVTHRAHRVIWLVAKGKWPMDLLDHADGNRANNCIANLSEVTKAQNALNKRPQRNNRSGCTGVCWHIGEQKWHAQISVGGERKHLGFFNELNAAIEVRKSAEESFGFHPNHGRHVDRSGCFYAR